MMLKDAVCAAGTNPPVLHFSPEVDSLENTRIPQCVTSLSFCQRGGLLFLSHKHGILSRLCRFLSL